MILRGFLQKKSLNYDTCTITTTTTINTMLSYRYPVTSTTTTTGILRRYEYELTYTSYKLKKIHVHIKHIQTGTTARKKKQKLPYHNAEAPLCVLLVYLTFSSSPKSIARGRKNSRLSLLDGTPYGFQSDKVRRTIFYLR